MDCLKISQFFSLFVCHQTKGETDRPKMLFGCDACKWHVFLHIKPDRGDTYLMPCDVNRKFAFIRQNSLTCRKDALSSIRNRHSLFFHFTEWHQNFSRITSQLQRIKLPRIFYDLKKILKKAPSNVIRG